MFKLVQNALSTEYDDNIFLSPGNEPQSKRTTKEKDSKTKFRTIHTITPVSSLVRRERLNSETKTSPILPEMRSLINLGIKIYSNCNFHERPIHLS